MPSGIVDSDEGSVANPRHRLYCVRAVFISAMIGTPLAGGVLIGLNCPRVEKRSQATASVLVPLAVTASLLTLALSTSPDNPLMGLVYWFVLGPITYLVIRASQSKLLAARRAAGGACESE